MALSWNQPICEVDWIEREGLFSPDEEHPGLVTLVGVREPIRIQRLADESPLPIEQCAFCGKPTIFGVYVRADPKSVPYPAEKKNE